MPFLTFFLIIFTSASGISLALILRYLSPVNPDGSLILINLIYFFISAWIFLASLISLLLYSAGGFTKSKKRRSEVEAVNKPKVIFRLSLKQGFLIATVLVGLGILKVSGFSNPLNVILILSAAILIEVYFFGH